MVEYDCASTLRSTNCEIPIWGPNSTVGSAATGVEKLVKYHTKIAVAGDRRKYMTVSFSSRNEKWMKIKRNIVLDCLKEGWQIL